MQKTILFFSFILCSCLSLGAQNEGPSRQRIEAMKVGFITEKVGLSTEQAQVFWPFYNEYEEAKKAIRKKYRPSRKIDQMSDAELETQMLNSFKQEQELLDLKKVFFTKAKSVISIRQIALLRSAEQEFNREVLKRMVNLREKRQQRLNGNN